MITDPTPETPFLRSDCDGSCHPSGLTSIHHHQHHHSHNHRPVPVQSEVAGPSYPPELLKSTPPRKRGGRVRESSASLSASDMARLKKVGDPDDPKRTDYTYSYSGTYRKKPPTPNQWDNPKMSRRGLHNREEYHSTQVSHNFMYKIFYWIYYKIRREEETITTTTTLDTSRASVANGPFEYSSSEDTSFDSTTDSPLKQKSSFTILNWLLATLYYTFLWPFERLYGAMSQTNYQRSSYRRRGCGCCCGWPLFCFNFLILLLVAAGLYARPNETQHILHSYLLPLPVAVWVYLVDYYLLHFQYRYRDIRKHRVGKTVNATRNYFSYSNSGIINQRIYEDNHVIDKGDVARLEKAIAQLSRRLDVMESVDMSVYVKEKDFKMMSAEDKANLEHVHSQLGQLSKALDQEQNNKETDRKHVHDELHESKTQLSLLSKRLDLLAAAKPQLPTQISSQLDDLASLVSRLATLEAAVAAQTIPSGIDREQLDKSQTSIRAEMSENLNQARNDWQIELIAIKQALKSQEEKMKIELTEMDEKLAVAIVSGSAKVNVGGSGLSADLVDERIAIALAKYDADKTGLVDHALEPAGGNIISTRCSETYSPRTRKESIFGVPLWFMSYSPRTVIQRKSQGTIPGECWAFKGSSGFLVIGLTGTVDIRSVTYEHIPKSLSPDGHLESAPNKFEIWGLKDENDENPVKLGLYSYDIDGPPMQHFLIENKNAGPVPIIEMKILSNHGHPVYTCLYRLRVHGKRISPAYGKVP